MKLEEGSAGLGDRYPGLDPRDGSELAVVGGVAGDSYGAKITRVHVVNDHATKRHQPAPSAFGAAATK